ncbi:MAG: chemotaxis response regulator protein-glutamate methylesterase [Pseudomonadota bacterium]
MRVVIVDDSQSMRQLLNQLISQDSDLEVVGMAEDPYEARDLIKATNPDVITLDVEMPKMDGLSFLRNIMRLRPMPVVLVSSLVGRNIQVAVEALEIGAVDVLTKPTADTMPQFGEQLREKLRIAGSRTVDQLKCGAVASPKAAPLRSAKSSEAASGVVDRVIAIGSSTGGTSAVKEILRELPGDLPPIMISQHIPEKFSKAFADSADRLTALTVVEAQDGDTVKRGHVYVAPGGFHLTLAREGTGYVCRVVSGDRVNGHRPSVEVMFDSVTELMGRRQLGVILTGMGNDGAHAMVRQREAGAFTVAQDEASSVVWGMPGEAHKLGGACETLPLSEIAAAVVSWCDRPLGKAQEAKLAANGA